MDAVAERNMNTMRTTYRTLQGGDLDACVRLLTEDFIANIPGVPEPFHGREVWRMGAQAMLTAFPDLDIEIENMLAAGDQLAVRARFRGTHRGEFNGVPATGRRVEFWSVEHYRFTADGRFAEEWVAPDIANLMRQLTEDAPG
ncbi:ester cyclase [Crossiella cryophila]|uniref:Steroid delta-isomerase-like uncharacterized protein n=1 Tax=Crossiella cryophila TaxID=43355 RepID=A0A7W7CAP9_9PSEU|nr:ester cyclase [Crossiella cryophila]MBB4677680.1 steroid delta-isomerase-like uncharacterized protein [Crossiella cryophila]